MAKLDLAKLAEAMDWVIPPDSSPGAGSTAGVKRLVDLIESLPSNAADLYAASLPKLTAADLDDPANTFAQLFIEHVKDVYYSYPDTGAWADIGFHVKDDHSPSVGGGPANAVNRGEG